MENIQYTAFISYRHKEPDIAAAKLIHRLIETYHIPSYVAKRLGKNRMGKVFRDQDELPLMADLGDGIRRALEGSQWLIVICSPDLPQSKWCMAEVDYFIELGRRDRILTVLVSGEPDQSFPSQLRFVEGADGITTEKEPLAADIRADNKADLRKKLRTEKLRLLAPMLGVGYDDLRRRQRERFLKRVAGVSMATVMLMAGAGAYVLNQNQLFQTQRDAALISQSKFLSGISGELLAAGDPATAVLLALEALPKDMLNPDRPLVNQAITALRNARASRLQGSFALSGGVSQEFVSNWTYLEGSRLLTYFDNDSQYFFHMPSGRMIGQINGTLEAHCPQRSLVAISHTGYGDEKNHTILYSLDDLTKPQLEITGTDTNHSISFSDDGRYLLRFLTGSSKGNFVELLDAVSGKSLYKLTEPELFPEVDLEQTFNHPYMAAVALSPDSKYLAVAIGRTEIGMEAVELYELPSGRKATSLEYDLSDGSSAWWQTRGIKNLAFSPNGQFLSAIDGESTVHIFGSSSGNRITSIPGSEAVGSAESYEIKTVFSPDSQWLAVWAPNSNLTVYRTQTGEFTAQTDPLLGYVDYAGFTKNATLILHRGSSDELTVLPLDTMEAKYTVTVPELFTDSVVLSGFVGNRSIYAHADGFTVFSGRGTYQLWEHSPSVISAPDIQRFDNATSDSDTARAFCPDGKRFAVSIDGVVKVYDTDTLALLAFSEKDAESVRARQLIWLPDGDRLLRTNNLGSVSLLDAASCEVLRTWPAKYTASPFATIACISPDGAYFALNNPSHIGGMYDLKNCEQIYEFPGEFTDEYGNGAMNFTCGYVFSPDGEQFYMGAPDGLVCIETKTGKVVKRFPYRPNYGMSISPDGEKLAFGGHTEDRSLTNCFFLLDTKTGAQLWCSETTVGIRGVVAWSPDGALVAASDTNDGRTTVWDSVTGDIKWIFDGYDPIFSADSGSLLIGASPAVGRNLSDTKTGSVLYDMQSGAITVQLPEIGICSPSGNAVLMQDAIWRMKPPEDLINDAYKQLEGRELTEDERQRFYLD